MTDLLDATDFVSAAELDAIIRQAAAAVLGDDVSDLEVTSVHSTLLTSVGLRAIRLARRASARGESPRVEAFASDRGFDFAELPREELVTQLEAASGFGVENCRSIVSTLEEALTTRAEASGSVAVEGLGTFAPHGGGGLRLVLDEDLRVVPPQREALTPEAA